MLRPALLLLLTVALAAGQNYGTATQQKAKKKFVPVVNRDEIEYLQGTNCPITYVEPSNPREALKERLSEGYKICKKGNIVNCPHRSVFYLDERRRNKCQKCECDTPSGSLYTATCNKVDCSTLPTGTPLPNKGPLSGRGVRQQCGPRKVKVCNEGCNYMARDARCVYCDCTGKVDLTKPEYQV